MSRSDQDHHDPVHGETFHVHAHRHPKGDAHNSHPHPSDAQVDTYEAANIHHFDAAAYRYDSPNAQKLAEKVGRAMIATGLFKQGVTTVMDFACGTGLLSRVLAAEDPKSIIGVDISQGMVDQYNKIVSDHSIPPEEMRAVCTTLDEGELKGMTFDVIVCSAAYHHFPSIDDATTQLVTYLNPGGSLLVADLIHRESTHEIFPENCHHIVAHRGGFTEPEIRSTFDKSGLKNITFEIVVNTKHAGHSVDLFLARGDK